MRNEADSLPEGYNQYLSDYKAAKQLGLAFYITAEIPSERVVAGSILVVGDDTTHGLYFNAKLEEGEKYKLFIRAMTQLDGVSFQ